VKDFFKPEDFHCFWMGKESSCSPAQAAEIANEKLNALILSWPLVYWCGQEELIYREHIKGATHCARLALIEEIVKEPCKHEPAHFESGDQQINCKYCGVELQATWSEKK